MRKITNLLTVLLCMGMFAGCTTEVAEFDSVKDAITTAEKEEKEAKKDEVVPKEKDVFDRQRDPDTLNFENSEELKKMLTNTLSDDENKKFFMDNQYNIIEFDGAIDLIELIPNKKTRYSLLLRAGDYDPNTQTGPVFQVKDVGAAEDSVKELFLTGNGEVGKQVKIKATIYGYDEKTGLVELKLISMSKR